MSDSTPVVYGILLPPDTPHQYTLRTAHNLNDPTVNCKDFGFIIDFEPDPKRDEGEHFTLQLVYARTDDNHHVQWGVKAKEIREALLGPNGKWEKGMRINVYFEGMGDHPRTFYQRGDLYPWVEPIEIEDA